MIYLLGDGHDWCSDDSGQTWKVDTGLETRMTSNYTMAISPAEDASNLGDHFDLVLNDMPFDPLNALVRFAVGAGGVFGTIDGVNWTRLLHAEALPGRPVSCCYDWVSIPLDSTLYVSLAGRSLVKITEFPWT